MVAATAQIPRVETFPGPGWVDLLFIHLINKGILPC